MNRNVSLTDLWKSLTAEEVELNYSPAWTCEEALLSRVVFHELEGNLVDAAALLRGRFFTLREAGDPRSLEEAEDVLAEMTELRADPGDIEQLRRLLPARRTELPPVSCPLASGTSVRVLFIGGNETQRAYEKEIRDEFAEQYSGVKLDFYYPGWGSNWNVHLERVRPMIMEADAVVLSRMVRTQFGRAVRATCDSSRPWFACTGTGKQSLKRSIEAAALWAAGKASP